MDSVEKHSATKPVASIEETGEHMVSLCDGSNKNEESRNKERSTNVKKTENFMFVPTINPNDGGVCNAVSNTHAFKEGDDSISTCHTYNKGDGNLILGNGVFDRTENNLIPQPYNKEHDSIMLSSHLFNKIEEYTISLGYAYHQRVNNMSFVSWSYNKGESTIISFGGCKFLGAQGDGADTTTIQWGDTAATPGPRGNPMGTYGSATFAVNSPYFIAKNIICKNTFPLPPPGAKLECLKQWMPREASGSITHVTYSCDSQSIYASFEDFSLEKESRDDRVYHENYFKYAIMSECQKHYVVAVLHRKTIDKGSICVPTILLKWKTLPPKYGNWNFSANVDHVFVVISDQRDKIKEYEAQDIKCKDLTYTMEKSLADEGMEFQVDSWCLDNANWNQSGELLSCHSYYLLEICKMEDQEIIRHATTFLQWDPGGWSLVHWKSHHA